ncbi:MAG: hypothetical protein H6807_06860 [Planctomycetes bacterium]|nr:hypothetical protein [Planctomycetota bacterium]
MTRQFPLALVAVLALAAIASAQAPLSRFDEVNATTTYPNGKAGDTFGQQIVPVGDINGNGTIDFAISDSGYSGDPAIPALSSIGAVHFFEGTGFQAPPIASIFGTTMSQSLGTALEAVGDIDSDGAPDLAIGSTTGAGKVEIYDLSTMNLTATYTGLSGSTHFGLAIETIASFDDDESDDLLVFDDSHAIVLDGVTGSILASASIQGNIVTLGRSIAIYDANGDGYDDFAIGDLTNHIVRVYSGSPTAFCALLLIASGAAGSNFGSDVCYLGEVGGVHRVAIGASLSDSLEIWNLDHRGPVFGRVATVSGAATSGFGRSVAAVAKPNGTMNVITPTIDRSAPDFVNIDSAGAVDFDIQLQFEPRTATVYPVVESAGDVSGNGYDDYLVASVLGQDTGDPTLPPPAVLRSVLLYVGGPRASALSRGFGAMASPLVMVPTLGWIGRPSVGNSAFSLVPSFSQVGITGQVVTGTPNPGFLVLAPNFYSWLNPLYSQAITTSLGAPVAYPIPANPLLIGMTFTAQAFVLGPVGFEFTNAVDYTIGY